MPRLAKSALAVVLVVLFSVAVLAAPAQAAGPGSQLGQERSAWLDFGFGTWIQQVLGTLFGTAEATSSQEEAPSRLFDKARVNFDPDGVYSSDTSPVPSSGGTQPTN